MASGEAEPLRYTTTALRVSIHCEGCKKKVRKVLHGIEGVYKVTVDAAQHKVVVTGSVAADALVRRLNKAGKQAALWPAPAAPAAEAKKKPEEAAPLVGGEVSNKDVVADKADAKPKDKGADKQQGESAEGSTAKKPEKESKGAEKKPEKGNKGCDKKAEKVVEPAKPKDGGQKDSGAAEKKEKGSPEPPAKEAAAAEEASGGEEGSAKKGGKKKNKQHKDGGGGGEGEATPAAEKKQPPQPVPAHAAPPPPHLLGPDQRPHGGGFPYYAAQPVMSYNVAHPSASVSYHYAAPTPAVPMQPVPPPPYGYPPHMMPPALPEYMYGPPGMRVSPPQESYNMFNEENANSCSLM